MSSRESHNSESGKQSELGTHQEQEEIIAVLGKLSTLFNQCEAPENSYALIPSLRNSLYFNEEAASNCFNLKAHPQNRVTLGDLWDSTFGLPKIVRLAQDSEKKREKILERLRYLECEEITLRGAISECRLSWKTFVSHFFPFAARPDGAVKSFRETVPHIRDMKFEETPLKNMEESNLPITFSERLSKECVLSIARENRLDSGNIIRFFHPREKSAP